MRLALHVAAVLIYEAVVVYALLCWPLQIILIGTPVMCIAFWQLLKRSN